MTHIAAHPEVSPAPASLLRQSVHDFLAAADFPCVGAKSALHKGRLHFAEYASLDDTAAAGELCRRLAAFSQDHPDPGAAPISFIAMFDGAPANEAAFESALWRLLQAMHEHDSVRHAWDASVSNDPGDSDFSFSIAGRAFFVVGLHPHASRLSRRAPVACLVFNFHNQFESLKATGKYQTMQVAIRARDVRLQGSINPVLARFGEASEARQYAGRAVDNAWRCPFHAQAPRHA